MIKFLRKASDSEQQQKEQLIQKINCFECVVAIWDSIFFQKS